MKKILCVAVLLVVAVCVFAEAEVSGELMFGLTGIGTTSASSATSKAEINFSANLDENTTVSAELDSEGDDWTNRNIGLDDFRVSSNLTGALGIDAVDLTVTGGLFDAYHCNWNYVSRSGEEYYYSTEAAAYVGAASPDTKLAANIALGIGGYTLQYWQNFSGTNMSVAFSGTPLDGLNFLVGYAAPFATVNGGNLWVEGGYEIAAELLSVFIPASFTYDIDDTAYGWSFGVAADIEAYHVSVGVGGASSSAPFKDCLIEVSTSAVENADIYVIGDLDFSEATAFQSVDIGGKYSFGAFGLGAGYVIASGSDVTTILWSDENSMSGSGAYIFADVDL